MSQSRDKVYIDHFHSCQVSGMRMPIEESAGVSPVIKRLVEEDYLFNRLQADAVEILASKLETEDKDGLFDKLDKNGGLAWARQWAERKFKKIIRQDKTTTTVYDIPIPKQAAEELAEVLSHFVGVS